MSPRLSRAKRIDNNKWVKGWHVVYHKQHFITNFTERASFIAGFERVIPSTIGQSTGLKDKSADKIEIYGGDIVGSKYFPVNLIVTQIEQTVNTGQWIVKAQDGGIQDLHEAITVDGYEVIGNIHDNPELLEEQP